jgi:hypothetical protein
MPDAPPAPEQKYQCSHCRGSGYEPAVGDAPRPLVTPEVMKWRVIAARMAAAIEKTLPISQEMFEQFPYAEMDGDDEAFAELRDAAATYRKMDADDLIAPDLTEV